MSTALEGNSPRIAVIDIGSNSIHLLVLGMDAMGKLLSIDSEKIILRLGETLDPEGNFPPGVRKSLIESLRLLHEIAYCYQPIMRIIASHAVRVAANQAELLAEIKNELGLEISVINGREEARLVALGMHYAAATQEKAFFGCDLGGGSTELFKVLRGKIVEASSQAIGTVTLNQHFIRGANDLDAALRRAEQHAESIFAPLAAQFPRSNDLALLSSSVGKTLVELARRQHQGTGINDSHGSILSGPKGLFICPAYPLRDVVDPTGAGDSFVGGLIGHLATAKGGVDANIRRAMICGSVVASYCCEGFGLKRTSKVTRRDIDARVKELERMTQF